MKARATKALKPGQSRPWIVGSLREVAIWAQVSTRTISIYVSKGMPGTAGNYNLSDIHVWIRLNIPVEHKAAKAAGRQASVDVGTDIDPDSLDELEKRKLRAHCERIELRLAKDRGVLLDRASAVASYAELVTNAKIRLEMIPAELSNELPPENRDDIRESWKQKIGLILKELSEFRFWDDGPKLIERTNDLRAYYLEKWGSKMRKWYAPKKSKAGK